MDSDDLPVTWGGLCTIVQQVGRDEVLRVLDARPDLTPEARSTLFTLRTYNIYNLVADSQAWIWHCFAKALPGDYLFDEAAYVALWPPLRAGVPTKLALPQDCTVRSGDSLARETLRPFWSFPVPLVRWDTSNRPTTHRLLTYTWGHDEHERVHWRAWGVRPDVAGKLRVLGAGVVLDGADVYDEVERYLRSWFDANPTA